MPLLSMIGHLAEQAFAGGETLFRAVAQTVGFGPGMSKMVYLSTGMTDSLSAAALFSFVSDRSNRQ
jgi:hypothetical protein